MNLKQKELFKILEQDASIHYYNRLSVHRLLKIILAFLIHRKYIFVVEGFCLPSSFLFQFNLLPHKLISDPWMKQNIVNKSKQYIPNLNPHSFFVSAIGWLYVGWSSQGVLEPWRLWDRFRQRRRVPRRSTRALCPSQCLRIGYAEQKVWHPKRRQVCIHNIINGSKISIFRLCLLGDVHNHKNHYFELSYIHPS